MNARIVKCKKIGKELPGLDKPPFPGKVGALIYESISKEGWALWHEDMQIKVLNEYRLNMADPEHFKVLVREMLRFLNLEDGSSLDVGNENRGRSS